MADRKVTKSGKDKDGDITSLCGTGDWSPRSKNAAIEDIETPGGHRYYVDEDGRVNVNVVTRNGKKHLQTTSDSKSKNNLDNLPDC